MIHPTYCSFPFNSIAPKSWYNGRPKRITPCCNMKTSGSDPMGVQYLIDSGASLQEIFESTQFEKLRADSIAGIRNPACNYCWQLEDKGVKSPRITDIEAINEQVTQPVIKKIDTMLDENCNLRCRMCAPDVSNSLRQDYNKILELNLSLPEYYTTNQTESKLDSEGTQTFFAPSQQYIDEIIKLSNTLEEIKFTGGEPTVSNNFWYIVNNITHPERIKIHLTTNATKFNNRFLDTMQIFNQRHFTLSIDGTRATYEYIRYPANWRKIETNINQLCKTQDPENTQIHICSVMSVYNMLNLRNLVDWIIQHNWGSKHKITWKCIPDPHPGNSCLDVRWTSEELLDIALKTFTACETDEYTTPAVQKTINYLQWCLNQNWDAELLAERRQKLKQDTLTLDIVRQQTYDEMLNQQIADFISGI